ncbi:hypothetical protein AGOR_G00116950 [Albula goreensis]|uniref:Outer kinetochore protein DAD2 n=1 Tax=Albula goreensis TaxID=1534307 RepID=A0A8T3DCN2_9TELE|nr:hypothetical protein AGOR_G00116950 [Albula goreensis]
MSNIKSGNNPSAADMDEFNQLKQELMALRRIRSSLHAVERMIGCLNQNVQLAIKNEDTLADLNQAWSIFFTGKK